jgi:hypothetical protein
MKSMNWAFGAGVLALSLIISGCAKKESESEKQLSETQARLDEANKKLESAGMKPVPNAPAASTTPATPYTAATTPGAVKTPPEHSAPVTHTIPAGAAIAVRTISAVSTKTSASGTTFDATLQQPLEVDGYVVAPRGATVECVVLNSDSGGRVKGVASIAVGLRRIVLADGRSLAVSTDSHVTTANSTKGKDAAKIGIASGIGAAIGAIAGGGKGAAIGAGTGAAGGTGLVLATKGAPAVIPSESVINFRLTAPVTVTESKR